MKIWKRNIQFILPLQLQFESPNLQIFFQDTFFYHSQMAEMQMDDDSYIHQNILNAGMFSTNVLVRIGYFLENSLLNYL